MFQSPACLSLAIRRAPRLGGTFASGGNCRRLGLEGVCELRAEFVPALLCGVDFCLTGIRSPTVSQRPPAATVPARSNVAAIFGTLNAMMRMTPSVRNPVWLTIEPAADPFVASPDAARIV